MATYKVGDKVRFIDAHDFSCSRYLIGTDGVIDALPGCYRTVPNNYRVIAEDGPIGAPPHHLAPLTPPAEDTWAADKVKQLTKPQYVEPVAPKVSA